MLFRINEIFIQVVNGRALVTRFVKEANNPGSPNAVARVVATNADALEGEALQVLAGRGKSLRHTGDHECPAALQARTAW